MWRSSVRAGCVCVSSAVPLCPLGIASTACSPSFTSPPPSLPQPPRLPIVLAPLYTRHRSFLAPTRPRLPLMRRALPWPLSLFPCLPPLLFPTARSRAVKQGAAGQRYRPPEVGAVRVFRMEGAVVVKLHAGTWHAGPLFTVPAMDFFNLELHDTNVVDHTTHSFADSDGVVFEFDDARS
ncbi:unnamed protein product [Closterium sp. NIES-53]